MVRSSLGLVLMALFVASGCTPQSLQQIVGDSSDTALVPPSTNNLKPGVTAPSSPQTSSYAPADMPTSIRVDLLAKKILAASPQAGIQPVVVTIGSPQVEIFHRGPGELYVTQGLVKKCASENQLAAVICRELGRMVAEREALASIDTRDPDRGPPPDVSFGNAGQIDAADQVRYAELAKLAPRRRHFNKPLAPPDPNVLARLYLKNAGYRETDLEAAGSVLQEANSTFQAEKLIKATPPTIPWAPAR